MLVSIVLLGACVVILSPVGVSAIADERSVKTKRDNGPSPTSCAGCLLYADEVFLTLPYSVSTISATIAATFVPQVTRLPDGTNVTNTVTYTQPSSGTDSAEYVPDSLTWEYSGVTLTYPTTYVYFTNVRGGARHTTTVGTSSICTQPVDELLLPTNAPSHLIVNAVGADDDGAVPIPIDVVDYLDSLPGITSMFSGIHLSSCLLEVGQPQTLGSLTQAVTHLTAATLTGPTLAPVVVQAAQLSISGSTRTHTRRPTDRPIFVTSNSGTYSLIHSGKKSLGMSLNGVTLPATVFTVSGKSQVTGYVAPSGGKTLYPGGPAVEVAGVTVSLAAATRVGGAVASGVGANRAAAVMTIRATVVPWAVLAQIIYTLYYFCV